MDYVKWARGQWDRLGAVLAAAGGLLALLLGWIGVSGSPYPAGQLPYVVSGGLLGIFLLGVGGTLWLSADLRDEWRKLDRVEDALLALGSEPSGTPEAVAGADATAGDTAAETAGEMAAGEEAARRSSNGHGAKVRAR